MIDLNLILFPSIVRKSYVELIQYVFCLINDDTSFKNSMNLIFQSWKFKTNSRILTEHLSFEIRKYFSLHL